MGVPMIGCPCAICNSDDLRNHRLRTGVVVAAPTGNLLIDTGPELRLQLVREKVRNIDGVLYTHAHADHIMGLDDLRIFGFRQQGPVSLYCEPPVEELLRRAFHYAFESPPDTLHSIPRLEFKHLDLRPVELCGLTFQPIRLIHGRLPILGFRMNRVAFCTDVSEIPRESEPLLEGLDVLILGAIRDEPHPTHFNIPQALEVVEKFRPRRTYLTHISHTLDHEATNARLPAGVKLAYDGLSIPL